MSEAIRLFEMIARAAYRYHEPREAPPEEGHPFDLRNIHPALPIAVRRLFDDGHYPQATFEAFKFVDNEVQRHSGSAKSGTSLMMEVFGGGAPPLPLTNMLTQSDKDEQEGFKFMFAGSMLGIRNPRGHSTTMSDDVDTCLDHLAFASMLLRRLAAAGYHAV